MAGVCKRAARRLVCRHQAATKRSSPLLMAGMVSSTSVLQSAHHVPHYQVPGQLGGGLACETLDVCLVSVAILRDAVDDCVYQKAWLLPVVCCCLCSWCPSICMGFLKTAPSQRHRVYMCCMACMPKRHACCCEVQKRLRAPSDCSALFIGPCHHYLCTRNTTIGRGMGLEMHEMHTMQHNEVR